MLIILVFLLFEIYIAPIFMKIVIFKNFKIQMKLTNLIPSETFPEEQWEALLPPSCLQPTCSAVVTMRAVSEDTVPLPSSPRVLCDTVTCHLFSLWNSVTFMCFMIMIILSTHITPPLQSAFWTLTN